jgi:hypothetical protein
MLLSVALGDITNFVPCDIASIVVFTLADELLFQDTLTMWDCGAGYKHEHVQVLKRFQLFMATSNLVFVLW